MNKTCVISGICSILLLFSLFPADAQVDPPLADLMLIDFDTFTGSLVVEEGSAAVVNEGGNNVLQLTAAAGERVKVRLKKTAGSWNLLDYVNLTMDLENTGGHEAWVRILIKDTTSDSDDIFYMPSCSHNAWVQPYETRIFHAMMPRNKFRGSSQVPAYADLFPRMNGLPHAQPLIWYGVDTMRINEVILQLEPQATVQTLRVDNLRGNRRAKPLALENDPTTNSVFFPFIDEYGQYMHEDWPGKITSVTDLTDAKTAEDADLAANPKPVIFNEYGGWANGPTLPATGHFRTEKVDGIWWFVDPVGKLFWSLGCNSAGLSKGETTLDGKEHFYRALPDRLQYPEYFTDKHQGQPVNYFNSYYPTLTEKYGSNFETAYNHRTLERIRSWGLNTLGAWSDASNNQPTALKTPYVKIVWTPGVPIPTMNKLDDPFHPGFRNAVINAIGWTGGAKDDPYCIGFFDQNEIEWGKDAEQETRDIMEQCDSGLSAKVAAVDFLQAEYGSIAAANAIWGSSYNSFNDLLPDLGKGNFNWPGAAADMKAFYAHLADTYYSEFRAAMKSVAPNKLYVGSRIKGSTMLKEVASAAAAHCDVVSFNIYQKDLYEFQGVTAENEPFFPEDKPFFVGEFNFGALDRGMFWTGIEYAADQRNRGEAYRHYVKSGLEDPRCIGAHWFAYKDGPLASRASDSENAAMGLLDSADTPLPEMIAALRQTASEMYGYRFGDSTYTPPKPAPLLANWQFNEGAGSISNAVDSAGDAIWANENDWMLNGRGQAVVTGVVNERNASPFSAVSEGSVFMRADYAGWDFDDLSQVRIGFKLNNLELYVRLRGRTSNPFFGVGNNNDMAVNAVSSDGMSVILGVDLDADTYSLWWDDRRQGSYVAIAADVSLGTDSVSVDAPYFRNTQFSGSNPIGIDMLLYGTNFADVADFKLSPYEIWSAAHELTGFDDDFDGVDNFTEFAFGGNPTNPADQGHPIGFNVVHSELKYIYPRRKQSGLLYQIETTTNLVSGVWTNAGYFELPTLGMLDAEFEVVTNSIPPTADKKFIRLMVEEN